MISMATLGTTNERAANEKDMAGGYCGSQMVLFCRSSLMPRRWLFWLQGMQNADEAKTQRLRMVKITVFLETHLK